MQRIFEELALLAVINPQTVANTNITSGWVDASLYHELAAQLSLGDMASETIDFKIEQATSSGGAGAKTLKASTQLAANASNNDNKQLQIAVTTDKLDSANGFKFVRLNAVTGGATGGPASGSLWGRPRFRPAAQAATVLETAYL